MSRHVFYIVTAFLALVHPISIMASTVQSAGVSAVTALNLRTGTVVASSDSWSTVSLDTGYASMVVVASANYPAGGPPAVVRVRNASGSSFDIMVQSPCNKASLTGISVDYVVVEEGAYNVGDHGVKAEAFKRNSQVTDNTDSWVGSPISYLNSYDEPVVLGQVMTANDTAWSQFWCRGSSHDSPPSSSGASIGKHVGRDTLTERADETVGYLVIESGSGTIEGMDYVAGLGPDTVDGVDNGTPAYYPFSPRFGSLTSVIVSQAGMDGVDGGWAVVSSKSVMGVSMVIEEDQCEDSVRTHTTEQVGYLALGKSGAVAGTPSIRTGKVTGNSDTWSTVTLDHSYNSMVVLASTEHPAGYPPAVVRVRNAVGNSFDVKVQSPCNMSPLAGVTVNYVVMEEGVYSEAIHGVTAEAIKLNSLVTDNTASWVGTSVPYANFYNAPVVLGQVMSTNDAAWSQFWCSGVTPDSPPSPSTLRVGKHVGKDTSIVRQPEVLGYLVIEAGRGMVEGLGFAAGVGADTIRGAGDGPATRYQSQYSPQTASSVIVTQAGMDGAHGGWAVVTSLTSNDFGLIIEEDQCTGPDYSHTTEQAAYLIIGDPSELSVMFRDGFETR